MTTRGTWKRREREVADFFHTERTPLSGGNSKHTRSDTLHETLYIECKFRKCHAVLNLWRDTKEKAEAEGKTPVIALCEKGKEGFWLLVHCDDLDLVKL